MNDMKKKIKNTIFIILLFLLVSAAAVSVYFFRFRQPAPQVSKTVHISRSADIHGKINKKQIFKKIEDDIKKRQEAAVAQAEAEAKKAAEEEAAASEAEAKSEIVIVLDPGHQGSHVDMSAPEPNAPGSDVMKAKCTSGTSGKYSGFPEYQLNLQVALLMRQELEARGYQVLLTREDNDKAISNAQRAQLANEAGADAYIRIHANGSENTAAQGALALVPSPGNAYVGQLHDQSYRLAEAILNAYCAETGFANKGIQENDSMTGINWSQVPVMIMEMGFMSNEHDDLAMADDGFQAVMVKGMVDGIDAYFSD